MSVARGLLEHQWEQEVAEFHCCDCQGEEGPVQVQALAHQEERAHVSYIFIFISCFMIW